MKRLWLILFIIPLFAQDINKRNIFAGFFDDSDWGDDFPALPFIGLNIEF